MKKKLKLEREVLSNKLMTVCDKLRETRCAFDEAKYIINTDLFNIKSTVAEMKKITKGEESKYNKIELEVKKLIEQNCKKDESLIRMNKKIEQLQQDNERNVLNMNKQIKKLQDCVFKKEKDGQK